MSPTAQDIIEQQEAISNKNQSGSTGQEAEGRKKGAQFTSLNSEYLKNGVLSLAEAESAQNKVIDVNTMMNAYGDFMDKARSGEGGCPQTFFITSLTKNDIAKAYIRRFYPNGAKSSKDRRKGELAMVEEKEDDKE